MSSIGTSCIVFACVFGGALLGMLLRNFLPEHHLDPDSRNVVNLGMALIGTMTALVLGVLIASAKSSYDTQKSEVTQMAANIVQLDRILGRYGAGANGPVPCSVAPCYQSIRVGRRMLLDPRGWIPLR